MILGVGTDLCDSRRLFGLLGRHSERFLQRFLTPLEYAHLQRDQSGGEKNKEALGKVDFSDPKENLSSQFVMNIAKIFAAKESIVKALGTGFAHGIGWKDVEIRRIPKQPPRVSLYGKAQEWVADQWPSVSWKIFLSLSDEWPYAQAFAVLSCHSPLTGKDDSHVSDH